MVDQRSVLSCCLSALVICASVHADAVQWRVEDGGNGHWYKVIEYAGGKTHAEALVLARQAGASLVSFGSAAELAFLEPLAVGFGPYAAFTLGGFQDLTASDYSEPSGGWRWDDGTPWSYTNWDCGVCGWWCQPDNYINQHFAVGVICGNRLVWDDGTAENAEIRAIYEWSADCNNDGVVDYGQILSGQLADADGDGVPNACEPLLGSLEVLEQFPPSSVVKDAWTRSAIVASGFPWHVRDARTGVDFVLVPAGTFLMGSTPSDTESTPEERPAHFVRLTRSFYIGRTEVTQAQWKAMTGTSPSYFGERPNNPVERVSWNVANHVAQVLRYALPTEAEWEYACRGGSTASRYGPINDIAWWGNGSGGSSGWGTNPVATKVPNGFGLYDMIGNVWEYCRDYWGPYADASQIDPSGVAEGSDRVARGGDWYWPAVGNRAPYRHPTAPDWEGLASNGVRFSIDPADTGLFDAASIPDCNGDGIADFAQCSDGTLADHDGDGTPDCCELGTPCSVGNYPVQWLPSAGGNGHWYQVVIEQTHVPWSVARERAAAAGGHLATIADVSEDEFVFGLANGRSTAWSSSLELGPWLGGSQQDGSVEPAGGWNWVTGEPWTYRPPSSWNIRAGLGACGGNADNGGAGDAENSLHYIGRSRCWNDARPSGYYGDSASIHSYVVEWSADCNNDGLVDYGQILSGQLADANGNGVPELCECPTDSDGDGTVDCIDGCPTDPSKTSPGICGCGVSDADSDGDGAADCVDGCPTDPGKIAPGVCGCGSPDLDADSDGRTDCRDVNLHLSVTAIDLHPGGIVEMRVEAQTLQPVVEIIGLQAALTFDASRLRVLGISPAAGSPLSTELAEVIDQTAGTIRYAVGAMPPDSGLTLGAAVFDVTLQFHASADLCATVELARLATVDGFGSLLAARDGSSIQPSDTWETTRQLDVTGPEISGLPAPATVPHDAGNIAGATLDEWQYWPSITDACGFTYERLVQLPDGTWNQWYWPSSFPTGTSTVLWRATDSLGNASEASTTITVEPHQLLDATIALVGAFDPALPPFDRTVRIEVGSTVRLQALAFVGSGSDGTSRAAVLEGLQLPVQAGAPCARAKDVAFSLTDATTASIENARYTASFALRQGDSNDDDAVDIIDYGIWYVDFGPAATTDRSNFNADGFVNNADFAWLGLHIFQRGETCGGFVPEGEPLRRISVKELRRRGLGDLAGADVNRDGWLDLRDVRSAASTPAAAFDIPD